MNLEAIVGIRLKSIRGIKDGKGKRLRGRLYIEGSAVKKR